MLDTEPLQGGDIYKMILGSFVPWYDYLDKPVGEKPQAPDPMRAQKHTSNSSLELSSTSSSN